MKLKCYRCGFEKEFKTRKEALDDDWGASPEWNCPFCRERSE